MFIYYTLIYESLVRNTFRKKYLNQHMHLKFFFLILIKKYFFILLIGPTISIIKKRGSATKIGLFFFSSFGSEHEAMGGDESRHRAWSDVLYESQD